MNSEEYKEVDQDTLESKLNLIEPDINFSDFFTKTIKINIESTPKYTMVINFNEVEQQRKIREFNKEHNF